MPGLEKFWTQNYFLHKNWILHLGTTNTRLMEMKGENLNDLSNKHKMLKMTGSTQISEKTEHHLLQNTLGFLKLPRSPWGVVLIISK